MLFIENNKKLSFQITGYQFFEDAAELDAEWLNYKIEYCENGIEKTFVEPCLLIGELDEFVSALSNILEGNAASFISEFVEPFLKIAFASVEKKIIFILAFVSNIPNDERCKIVSLVKRESAVEFLHELQAYQRAFPRR